MTEKHISSESHNQLSRPMESPAKSSPFPASAPSALPVFYRTYSRSLENGRETVEQQLERTVNGLAKLGKFTPEETALIRTLQRQCKVFPSGRWMWVGGTPWSEIPQNFGGLYNCTSRHVRSFDDIALLMDLCAQGCGIGAVLSRENVEAFPVILNPVNAVVLDDLGTVYETGERIANTNTRIDSAYYRHATITVGDSRQGWAEAYKALMLFACMEETAQLWTVTVSLAYVRPEGVRIKGFGGVSNPSKLPELFPKAARILSKAVGRKLSSIEICMLLDEASKVIVAGNVRRSAGMRQFDADDIEAATAKDNLWTQVDGKWVIDPERDALRMSNHTRVFHYTPSYEEIKASISKQYHSGEGAIQFAPAAIARANADLIAVEHRREFCETYPLDYGISWFENAGEFTFHHRIQRYGLNPCGEIIGKNYYCNLSEVQLNQLDPFNLEEQEQAFRAASLQVAALLHHKFVDPEFARSRELDPIVGVGLTGLFDFFVNAFGVDWLKWWEAGRPEKWGKWVATDHDTLLQSEYFKEREEAFLRRWSATVHTAVWDYCDRHGLKRPNRCTTVKPSGTLSLLTGASPGWHPPKAQRFIRRITFRRDDPVALACIDYGYRAIPSVSCKDEQGRILPETAIDDPRCDEWLIEIPTETSWANLPGVDGVAIEQFSATAQFDFYMQVQKFYTTHNTSATLEFRRHEIEPLAKAVHEAILEGEFVSAAMLARFDDRQTFPRLPFEPISKATYQLLQQEVLDRRTNPDFYSALLSHDKGWELDRGSSGCDSTGCELPNTQTHD
jgi:ribonucleotide reductase class II